MDDANIFRVLVAEDDGQIVDAIVSQLEGLGPVAILAVGMQQRAIEALGDYFFHVAIVDIELDTISVGHEVLDYIATHRPATRVVVATLHTDPETVRTLFGHVFDPDPESARSSDKNDPPIEWAWTALEVVVKDWRQSAVTVSNMDFLLTALERRAADTGAVQEATRARTGGTQSTARAVWSRQ